MSIIHPKVADLSAWDVTGQWYFVSCDDSVDPAKCRFDQHVQSEGAVYLTSLGRPTDIGLQLGKACYPCSG